MNETRCSICGCITDPSELSSVTLSTESFDICPFCNKKIKAINEHPIENASLAREILTADTKGKRNPQCSAMLYRHFFSLGINPTETVATKPNSQTKQLEAEVQELKSQVEALASDLKKFKRRYYLSRILGVIAPVILTFIMLLIFLKSGLLDNIFAYYDFLGKYANM